MASERDKQLDEIITSEKLNSEKTRKFMENCFYLGEVRTTGTDIDELLPPRPRFALDDVRAKTKGRVIEKLQSFYEKFSGIGGEFKADAPRVEFSFGSRGAENSPTEKIVAPNFEQNLRAAQAEESDEENS